MDGLESESLTIRFQNPNRLSFNPGWETRYRENRSGKRHLPERTANLIKHCFPFPSTKNVSQVEITNILCCVTVHRDLQIQ